MGGRLPRIAVFTANAATITKGDPEMGITGVWGYAMSALSAYVALGVAWYLLDRAYGVYVYRWLYDFFHTEPMPAAVTRGVMFNQPTNRKVTVAFVISTIQSAYMIWTTEVNFLVELIMWLLEVPALLIGFALGAWVQRFLVKRSIIFDRLDEFSTNLPAEAGQMRSKLEGGAEQVGAKIAGLPATILDRFWNIVYPTAKPTKTASELEGNAAPAVTPKEPEPDSRKAFDAYTRRR
jgi:hypothetical protein